MSSFIHKKLKAFTLLELLVGMIISGIVIAAGFNAYRVISTQFKTYKETSAVYSSFSFFEAQFRQDFRNAKEISAENENSVQFISGEKKTGWRFNEKYALRNDRNETDTFFVSPANSAPGFIFSPRSHEGTKETELNWRAKFNINGHSCEIDCIKDSAAVEKVQMEFEKMIEDGN
jgi:prepilin-type N-terminal cleavage/methylation domain-containing protein